MHLQRVRFPASHVNLAECKIKNLLRGKGQNRNTWNRPVLFLAEKEQKTTMHGMFAFPHLPRSSPKNTNYKNHPVIPKQFPWTIYYQKNWCIYIDKHNKPLNWRYIISPSRLLVEHFNLHSVSFDRHLMRRSCWKKPMRCHCDLSRFFHKTPKKNNLAIPTWVYMKWYSPEV